MSDQFCEHEAAVVRAARADRWESTLRNHVDSCAVCREAVEVTSAMNLLMMAEADQIPSPPDPRLVWLKASFAERQRRSAVISRIAGVAYSALGVALLLALYWSFKNGRSFPVTSMPSGIGLPASGNSPVPLLLVSAVILATFILFSPRRRRSASSGA